MAEVRKVGVVGLGAMGAGIAQLCIEAGVDTLGREVSSELGEKARDRIAHFLTRKTEKGQLEQAARDDAIGRLTLTTELADLADCDLVVEAIVEELEPKRELFAELGRLLRDDAVLATNTSALPVTEIATAAARPERVVGLHFFNPAPVLPLVEVVAGRASAAWAVERAAGIVEGWGKTPIRVADSPGFIVNRVNRPFTLEPLRLLRSGAGTIESIDAALTDAGFPMGPFALMDLIGIDVNLAAARGLFEAMGRPPRLRPSPIQEELAAAGRLGRKAGEGFYRYVDGRRDGPAGRFAGVVRHGPGAPAPLDGPTIAERVILAIVNEAFRALGDGVADEADIDLAMKLGANHPLGPFDWAARTGIHELVVSLDALSDEDADTFRPALALLRRARAGG